MKLFNILTKKFISGSSNLDVWAKPSRAKTIGLEATFLEIEANPGSNIVNVSGKLCISLIQCGSSNSWRQQKHSELLNCAWHYRNFAKLLTYTSKMKEWNKSYTKYLIPTRLLIQVADWNVLMRNS